MRMPGVGNVQAFPYFRSISCKPKLDTAVLKNHHFLHLCFKVFSVKQIVAENSGSDALKLTLAEIAACAGLTRFFLASTNPIV